MGLSPASCGLPMDIPLTTVVKHIMFHHVVILVCIVHTGKSIMFYVFIGLDKAH